MSSTSKVTILVFFCYLTWTRYLVDFLIIRNNYYFIQYYPIIEINISKCRNNGIDCKIHGMSIVGVKKQCHGELKTSVSFLANDWDLNQEQVPAGPVPVSIGTSFVFLTIVYRMVFLTVHDPNSDQSQMMGCRVFVWGLNDKDQLGGMKGSKVKLPVQSDFLSQLWPIHIAGGSKSLFIVSHEGKVSY